MKKILILFGMLWVLLPISACAVQTKPTATNTNLPPTATRKKAAAPTAGKHATVTMTQAVPTADHATESGGKRITVGVIHFNIPDGLASSAVLESTTREELPYINPSAGPFPEHWVVTLEGYKLADTSLTPVIVVFHTDDALEIYQDTIDALWKLQSAGSLPDYTDLFVSRFAAQVYPISSPTNAGVRFLTQMILSISPINNDYIFYYYRGLSGDGEYYISAELPVHAPFLLQSCCNDSVPPGGIPFPDDPDSEAFDRYLQDVAAKIEAGRPEDWQPSLLVLDELIRSIAVG
jgi:hypothetical protein